MQDQSQRFDCESDRQNPNAGPFTGGSRVLVDGKLGFGEVRRGIFLAFGLSSLLLCYLLATARDPAPLRVNLLMLVLLALGYTVPPLKLSHRGLGELVVAVTHSIGVILPGYLLQDGDWQGPLPWLLSLPLRLSILTAIILVRRSRSRGRWLPARIRWW